MNTRVMFSWILLLLTAGCTHVRTDGGKWGEGVTALPDWETVKQAAVEAAVDPRTWAPALMGTAVLQIGNADKDIVGDAGQENPSSGSGQAATNTGDWLRLGALGLYIGLELAASSPEDSGEWRRSRLGGFLTGTAAMGITARGNGGLRQLADRTRPNLEYLHNLPSSHAGTTMVGIYMANTTGSDELNRSGRAYTGLFALDAWEYMEAGKHNPSDVFLGSVLGNFLSRFTRVAFPRPLLGEGVGFTVDWLPGGSIFKFYLDY